MTTEIKGEFDFGNYKVRPGFEAENDVMKTFPLYGERRVDEDVHLLRSMLRKDGTAETKKALQEKLAKEIERFRGHWFQRIDYPKYHISSTSNHDLAYIDEGGLNTLGNRLTSEEASILRPWPKWLYLKPLLPQIRNKKVLEIGSSNGFFSFRFAELGASQVTGVEILQRQYESALWSNSVLQFANVSFINTDVLMDLTIPKHDIVFLSEVLNHFLFPLYGLHRVISLAREKVILDTGVINEMEGKLNLHTAWTPGGDRLIYHSFDISHGLITGFLNLIGIKSSNINCYKDENGNHNVYIIDTKEINEHSRHPNLPEYLTNSLHLNFTT